MNGYLPQLKKLKNFFDSGNTNEYSFRRLQLQKLKASILLYENELHEALYKDLRKSPEESWITETGFIISEINHCLKNFKNWMKREKVKTTLLNFPSRSYIYKEPRGVVLIIGPWNYPLQLLITPLVGAIAAGNCVVLKPSDLAPAVTAVIKKIIKETFPEDYIFIAEGDGAIVIPELMEDFQFDHIFFTGSTQTGKKVYELAAKSLTSVTLELGGKSPCIIESDADIKVAAKRIAITKFSNAGQMCVAPDYLLVHQSIKHEFLEALKKSINDFYTAEPFTAYNYGKIINRKSFERLKNLLTETSIVIGGNVDEEHLLIAPTIIDNISVDSNIMKEEIFGPILPIISFETFKEAKDVVDKNPDPLSLYVFTSSKKKEQKWLQEVRFGGGCINNASWHLTNFYLPFGGRGNSGIGSYHGKFSFDVFTHLKGIMKTPTWFDPAIKYPPYKGKLNLFKKIVK